jgi:hypothetical protein
LSFRVADALASFADQTGSLTGACALIAAKVVLTRKPPPKQKPLGERALFIEHFEAVAMTYRSLRYGALRHGYISALGRDAKVHPEK